MVKAAKRRIKCLSTFHVICNICPSLNELDTELQIIKAILGSVWEFCKFLPLPATYWPCFSTIIYTLRKEMQTIHSVSGSQKMEPCANLQTLF